MRDIATDLLQAMERRDPEGIRAGYAPDARLVTMSPNSFQVSEGLDAVAAKLADWYAGWEEAPAHPYARITRNGDRVVIELERTSTYEGAGWVVRQAHVLEVGPHGITEHHIYCTGPREGTPELAAAAGTRS